MILISKSLVINSLIFPRAGNLMNQTKRSKVYRYLIRYLFKKSDYFLCQGKVWYEYAINDLKIDEDKVEIINNWTASEELIKIGENRIIDEKKNGLKIVFIGWLEKSKGVVELVNAFNGLIKHYDINLYLIGDGRLKRTLEKFILDNKLEKNIHLLGWLDDFGVKKNLIDADIFVLPSKNEGMPNSLIESMASGVPSICSKVGSVPNFILNEENGILIESHDIDLLKKTMEKLILDFRLRKKISKNGIITAKNNFSEKHSLNKLVRIIRKIK